MYNDQLYAPNGIHQLFQVTITVIYTGLKATRYFSTDSHVAVITLKKDLERLKFPAPKATNVTFVSHGCMGAFWVASTDSVRDKLPILNLIKSHSLVTVSTSIKVYLVY